VQLPHHLLQPLEAISRGFHQKLHLTIRVDLPLPVIERIRGLQADAGHKPTFEKQRASALARWASPSVVSTNIKKFDSAMVDPFQRRLLQQQCPHLRVALDA